LLNPLGTPLCAAAAVFAARANSGCEDSAEMIRRAKILCLAAAFIDAAAIIAMISLSLLSSAGHRLF
jgi:hypothetical protein